MSKWTNVIQYVKKGLENKIKPKSVNIFVSMQIHMEIFKCANEL